MLKSMGSGGGGGGGSGTVTSVSVVTSNGISGSVSNPTTTPALTIAATGRLLSFQILTGSGTYTPTAGTNFIQAIAIGGGGGGAGSDADTNLTPGGGGGGGAVSYFSLSSPLAANYAYAAGAGGTAGAANGGSGGNGGSTTFGGTITAPGGFGAAGPGTTAPNLYPVISAPGQGANTATGGSINRRGDAGTCGALGDASFATYSYAGNGGNSPYGTGGQGNGWYNEFAHEVPASAATGYGAGGRGGNAVGGSDDAGTAGMPGVILIWEYA